MRAKRGKLKIKISRWFSAAFLALLASAWFSVSLFSPLQISNFLGSSPLRCPLRMLTGLKCAFCGMTHAWIAILKGDAKGAIQENILSIPIFFAALFYSGLNLLGKLPNFSPRAKRVFLGSLILALSLYTVVRNI